jgi:hypothetical protein
MRSAQRRNRPSAQPRSNRQVRTLNCHSAERAVAVIGRTRPRNTTPRIAHARFTELHRAALGEHFMAMRLDLEMTKFDRCRHSPDASKLDGPDIFRVMQIVEQRLCHSKIGRFKALCEPVVNRRQELSRIVRSRARLLYLPGREGTQAAAKIYRAPRPLVDQNGMMRYRASKLDCARCGARYGLLSARWPLINDYRRTSGCPPRTSSGRPPYCGSTVRV